MTPIADMIAEMHASGIQLEMIIVAVRSIERAMSTRHPVDKTAENRRAWDREYRRNKRLARPPDQPDVHPIPPDVGVYALSFLEKKDSYPEVVSKKERKTCGKKLPPDWRPKPLHYEAGEKLGMNRGAVDERAVAMRMWCDANANRSITTKANWDAAFMGAWLKDSRNGNGTSNIRMHPASEQSGSTSILAGVAAATERRARERAAAGRERPVSGDSDPSEASGPELFGGSRSAAPYR